MDDPVERQVGAFNAHDLDAFLACYAPDVVIRLGDGTIAAEGLEQMRTMYARTFAALPPLVAEVRNRLRSGSWVVDEEHVTGGGRTVDALVAYEVRAGLIRTVLMLT